MTKSNTMTKLESISTTPFEDWEDWLGKTEDGDSAVVTFQTMDFYLYKSWWRQAVEFEGETDFIETDGGMYQIEGDTERKIDHTKFDSDKVDGPGVYEDQADRCYTIILPHEFMTFGMCQKWIEKLNKRFDTDFELVEPSKQVHCPHCGTSLMSPENWKTHFENRHPEKVVDHKDLFEGSIETSTEGGESQ